MTAKKIEGLNPVFNQEMLLEYFHENLNHARHVENERMMFITLFTALVGGALGMVAEIDSTSDQSSDIMHTIYAEHCLYRYDRAMGECV